VFVCLLFEVFLLVVLWTEMEMGGDDAESEPGQHEADMALADASVETASGTVHVATAVPVSGAGLQVQPPMAITQCQLALTLSRLMAVAAFSLFLPFPKRTGPNVLENDFLPAKPKPCLDAGIGASIQALSL
jgi:hypothetical protein